MKKYNHVPELRLADYTHGNAAQKTTFQKALYDGFKYFGFIILRDHGISDDLLEQAYGVSESFFAQPTETKENYIVGQGGARGYTPFGKEHAKDSHHADLKEFWHVGRNDNIWPKEPSAFEDVFQDLYAALDEAGTTMLEALAPSLGLDKDYFKALCEGGNSILRLLHYPPLEEGRDPNSVRAGAHEDINLITLLVAASSSGLELLERDGTWLPVEGSKNALIVDAGDMLARITNNLIPATTHRVVNPTGPNLSRYSMPFFLHPKPEAVLSCIEHCRDGNEMPDIIADDFLTQRLREIGLIE